MPDTPASCPSCPTLQPQVLTRQLHAQHCLQSQAHQGLATVPGSCLTLLAINSHRDPLTRVGMVLQPFDSTLPAVSKHRGPLTWVALTYQPPA